MQRKATKNTRGPNALEKAYQKWIKESNYCVACRNEGPVICHHCEGSTFRHLKTLIGHLFCIGLCGYCDDIITRGSRRKFVEQFGPQCDLWERSIKYFIMETEAEIPKPEYDAIMDWGR